MKPTHRMAFTLWEMIFIILFIIPPLVMLLLPAVQAARERARQLQCQNNLAQLVTAVHNYELAQQVYPPGVIDTKGPVVNTSRGYHHGWIVQLLPYFEQTVIYRQVDFRVGVYHKNNSPVAKLAFPTHACPSDGAPLMTAAQRYVTSYAAVHHDVESPIDVDNHGVFFLNSRLRHKDLTDGAGQTLFIGEKLSDELTDLGWMSGTRATLRNTGMPINADRAAQGASAALGPQDPLPDDPATAEVSELDQLLDFFNLAPPTGGGLLHVGGFGSSHAGGAQFAFGDGHVRFLVETMDHRVLQRLAHRKDGELVKLEW